LKYQNQNTLNKILGWKLTEFKKFVAIKMVAINISNAKCNLWLSGMVKLCSLKAIANRTAENFNAYVKVELVVIKSRKTGASNNWKTTIFDLRFSGRGLILFIC